MATSYWSGTDTQLIPSGRIKYTDGTFADTRVFDRVTQASHGFTGRVPVYYNTTSSLWVAAQANAVGTIATHIAKVVDSNTLDVVLNGKVTDTSHGLTAGQYYFVSDSAAGTLTVTEPTAVGSFSNPMIYVTDANTYILLGYRSSQTVNQSFNPLLNDGTAAAPSLAFSADTNTGIFRPGADQFSISTGGTERFRIESTGQIKAVYESTVGTDYNTTLDNGYFCRAWVNFDGTGTVAIRASGNVSSITDNGTGDYTVNFTTAMPDANYSIASTAHQESVDGEAMCITVITRLTGSFRTTYGHYSGGTYNLRDCDYVGSGVFR